MTHPNTKAWAGIKQRQTRSMRLDKNSRVGFGLPGKGKSWTVHFEAPPCRTIDPATLDVEQIKREHGFK